MSRFVFLVGPATILVLAMGVAFLLLVGLIAQNPAIFLGIVAVVAIAWFALKASKEARLAAPFDRTYRALELRPVRVPAPLLPLIREADHLPLPLLLGSVGEPPRRVWRDLAAEGPLLVVGGAAGERRAFLDTVLAMLTASRDATQLRVVLLDPRRLDLLPWTSLDHVTLHSGEIANMRAMLTQVVGEMERRYRWMEARHRRDLDGHGGPHVVVVVEDYENLLARTHGTPAFPGAPLDVLLQSGRAARIQVILAADRPGKTIEVAREACPLHIAFRLDHARESRAVLGSPGAETLPAGGGGLARIPTGADAGLLRFHVVPIADRVRDAWLAPRA